MGMFLRTAVVSKKKLTMEKFKVCLSSLLDFDGDINGDNGEEFISDEAKQNGFDNDIDYVLSLLPDSYDFSNIFKDLEYMDNSLSFFLSKLIDKNFYTIYEYSFENIDDKVFIAVAVYGED